MKGTKVIITSRWLFFTAFRVKPSSGDLSAESIRGNYQHE